MQDQVRNFKHPLFCFAVHLCFFSFIVLLQILCWGVKLLNALYLVPISYTSWGCYIVSALSSVLHTFMQMLKPIKSTVMSNNEKWHKKVYVYTLDTKAFVGDVLYEKTSCSGSSSTQKVFVGPPHKLWALVHSIEFQLAITAVLSLLDVSSSSSWWMAAGFLCFGDMRSAFWPCISQPCLNVGQQPLNLLSACFFLTHRVWWVFIKAMVVECIIYLFF